MRNVVVNHITLDGVMQAPGRTDEDSRGGFERGGWAAAGNDEVMARKMGERMIHRLVLGSGKRLFADGGAPASMKLVDVTPTTTGVLIATYKES